MPTHDANSAKDDELLDSSRSPLKTDSIIDKISRIRRELAKGESVYSPEELRRLQGMLEEYSFMLEMLHSG